MATGIMTGLPSIMVTDEAVKLMVSAGLGALPRETGGILAGFRSEDDVVVTRAAIVPDAGSSNREYWLYKCRASVELDRLKGAATDVVGYVGDWHTHPIDAPPSNIDIDSLKSIARTANDLVALLVLPFHQGKPQPLHARIGMEVKPVSVAHRRRVAVHRVPVVTTSRTSEELERLADGRVNIKE